MNDAPQQLMVCITKQKASARLIRTGAALAQKLGLELTVVHVAPFGENILGSPKEGAALDYLFSIAKQYHAPMQMLRSDQVAQTLANFARENHIVHVVMGGKGESRGLIREFSALLPEMEITVENYK